MGQALGSFAKEIQLIYRDAGGDKVPAQTRPSRFFRDAFLTNGMTISLQVP
jgi:hypothetical protein